MTSTKATMTSTLTSMVIMADTKRLRSNCLIAIVEDMDVRMMIGKNPKNQIQLDTVVDAKKTKEYAKIITPLMMLNMTATAI